MPQEIHVHLLPSLFTPEQLTGATAVVVDILRASTTISFALANGARQVIPCGSVEDALQLRNRSESETFLLGGERGGVQIEGFDLSNSPDDYSPQIVRDRTIGFTTTNGTRALLRSEQASTIFIGAFVNFSALVSQLTGMSAPVHIVCAGTNEAITGEDVLFAGALSLKLCEFTTDAVLSDATTLAINHWQQECDRLSSDTVEASLRRSQGGRNLIRLSYDKDITTAATLDAVQTVGIVDENMAIRTTTES